MFKLAHSLRFARKLASLWDELRRADRDQYRGLGACASPLTRAAAQKISAHSHSLFIRAEYISMESRPHRRCLCTTPDRNRELRMRTPCLSHAVLMEESECRIENVARARTRSRRSPRAEWSKTQSCISTGRLSTPA